MARINPLTGLPEEENPAGMVEAAPLVDPNAAAAGLVPGVAPVLEAPTEMAGRGGAGAMTDRALAAAERQPGAQSEAPAAPMIQIGGPKVDSTTTTNSTTREIVAPAVQEAAEGVQAQAQKAAKANENVARAEARANEEQTKFLGAVRGAAKTEAEEKAKAAKAVVEGRAQAALELQRQEAAAAEKVKFAQDAEDRAHAATGRTFWNDKPWFYEALAGIAVAASRRNLRAMGEDPNKSGVAQTITGLLEQDKAKKMQTYMRSKEFLADAKKLPGKAREAYNLKLNDLEAAQSAQLKLAAAEAEKLKATADADPKYIQSQQDVLLLKANELSNAARIGYGKQALEAAQVANPNVQKTSGQTQVDVDESAQAAKPPPLASITDVKEVQEASRGADEMEALAKKIESMPNAWDHVKAASRRHEQEAEVPQPFRGFGRSVGGVLPAGPQRYFSGSATGATVEDKLRGIPQAQGINAELENVKTRIAKGFGGVMTEPDVQRAAAGLGIQGKDAKQMAEALRAEAKKLRENAAQMQRQRDFR